MKHPLDARCIGDLGIDYLVDRVRADLMLGPGDPGHLPGLARAAAAAQTPPALHDTLRSMLAAAARLAAEPAWRQCLESAAGNLGDAPRSAAEAEAALAPVGAVLGTMVLEREGGRSYTITRPLDSQLSYDANAVLAALALVRHAAARWRGEDGMTLAAELRPRDAVPPRGPAAEGGLEIVQIGDLGELFSCRAHQRVYRELDALGVRLRWRWLYCASYRFLPASHRAGTLAETVLEHAPGRFWHMIDILATRSLTDALEAARATLAEAGADPALAEPAAPGTPLPAGLVRDRQVADACGLPPLRPLFAVGRTLFAGLDAAPRIRDHVRLGVSDGRIADEGVA